MILYEDHFLTLSLMQIHIPYSTDPLNETPKPDFTAQMSRFAIASCNFPTTNGTFHPLFHVALSYANNENPKELHILYIYCIDSLLYIYYPDWEQNWPNNTSLRASIVRVSVTFLTTVTVIFLVVRMFLIYRNSWKRSHYSLFKLGSPYLML